MLDLVLRAFGSSLQPRIAQIQADITAMGETASVGFVDTFSAMEGGEGLLLIERRFGYTGGFTFEIHPSNAGHTVIAAEFAKVWDSMR